MPRKPNKNAKSGRISAGKGKPTPDGKADKQSLFSSADAEGTVPEGAVCAEGHTPRGGENVFAVKPEEAQETEVSIADLFTAHAESAFPTIAQNLGRTAEFNAEQQEPGFQFALEKWRQAERQSLAAMDGSSMFRPYLRGPTNGRSILFSQFVEHWRGDDFTDLVRVIEWTRSKGGGEWEIVQRASAEEWTESVLRMLRNPIVPRAKTLQINAAAFYRAAAMGNVRFFQQVSEVFRRPERLAKRGEGGSAKSYLLHFWIPAGLWKLNVPNGCERINGYVATIKAAPPVDPAFLVVGKAAGPVSKKAYEQAKRRLGL